jgi:hypothetical protein
MSIRELIESRTKKQTALNKIVSEYICKYIEKIHKSLDEKRTIHFQKVLLYISEWDENRLLKFYNKFNRYLSKRNRDYDLQNNLDTVISLNVKIMLALSHENDKEFKSPQGHVFLYKCLRSVAKAYYNTPKYRDKDVETQLALISQIVDLCLGRYIPTREIMGYYSDNTEYLSDTSSTDEEISVQKMTKQPEQPEPEPEQEPVLNYLLRDEYYESDDDNIQHEKKDDVKQITLLKKPKRV